MKPENAFKKYVVEVIKNDSVVVHIQFCETIIVRNKQIT